MYVFSVIRYSWNSEKNWSKPFFKKKLKYINKNAIFAFIESKQKFLPDLGLFDELMSIVSISHY